MPNSRRDGGRDLEQELRDFGSHLEYPPTPDLARTARLRLEAEVDENAARTARGGRFWLPALSPRWAVAAMFMIVLAVPALSPNARDALSGLFLAGGAVFYESGAARSGGEAGGAGEDKIMSGQAGTQNAPSAAEEAMPESASGGQADSGGTPTGLGEQITLQEARSRTGDAPLLLPRTKILGPPDEVYAAGPRGTGGAALVYRARFGLPPIGGTEIGLVLTELPGGLASSYLGATPEAALEAVSVGNMRGYWVPGGRGLPETTGRTKPPGGVLLWKQGGRALRLESNLAREEAIRIAESVR